MVRDRKRSEKRKKTSTYATEIDLFIKTREGRRLLTIGTYLTKDRMSA